MFDKIKNIFTVREKLTAAMARKLVGPNTLYYNFDNQAWNTNQYNGYKIRYQYLDTGEAKEFKFAMEKIPEFSTQYEMVAPVIMTICSEPFPDCGVSITNPQYSKTGTTVVGNIIVWNKKTKKFELYGKSWGGVLDYHFSDYAAENGARGFMDRGTWDPEYRIRLIAAHTH